MENDIDILQQNLNNISVPFIKELHSSKDVPEDFRPWKCDLSPSALYNCSLSCRKKMRMKTPETKWMSIKRWMSNTPLGYELPEGVYFSIKRKEEFEAIPEPHFEKTEYCLIMFPYGNVWSKRKDGEPITEEWILSKNGKMLSALINRDALHPINGYFKACHEYFLKNPDQIGIHLKRKRKEK